MKSCNYNDYSKGLDAMRINTQFPVAVHILSALAYFSDDPLPSEIVAKSIGTNPVVVRRIMSRLRKKGLVDTKPGVKGGVLTRDPGKITLLDVYNAVRTENDTLFDIHPGAHPDCPVGAHFFEAINKPLLSAQRTMEKELASYTLLDVLKFIKRSNAR